MKIVMTGGGSGGHITPILAVAHEIKDIDPTHSIAYIGQSGDSFGEVVGENDLISEAYSVQAGKFRRYHGEGFKQFLDFDTMRLNVRDSGRVIVGFFQSVKILRNLHPDVVFCKGGFVGVPVGLAAALLRIPYVTHDSDATAGLANRIIARWARRHAVALDSKLYPYNQSKMINVGVPIAPEYVPVTAALKQNMRKRHGFERFKQIIFVTGGGLGAKRLNDAMISITPRLLRAYPELLIVHMAGRIHEKTVSQAYSRALDVDARRHVIVRGFIQGIADYSGAADLVIARGGATNFAELAAQAKPSIIVPNPLLTGGHQLKNAQAYEENDAVIVVQEADLNDGKALFDAITSILNSPSKQLGLAKKIHKFARKESARDLAMILLKEGKREQ